MKENLFSDPPGLSDDLGVFVSRSFCFLWCRFGLQQQQNAEVFDLSSAANMFLVQSFFKKVIDVVSDIDPSQFHPSDPPPPRRPLNFAETHESEEEKKYRRLFSQLAGDDMEVSPTELMDILNKIVTKFDNMKTDGFSIESCRSMVAVMDSDSTGKLGFQEFIYLWGNIKKWQSVYVKYDADGSGVISARELPGAFQAAGFPLNEQLYKMIVRRYSDEHENMDFDNFIGCLVRLDAMCRECLRPLLSLNATSVPFWLTCACVCVCVCAGAFKTLDKDNNGSIELDIKEVKHASTAV
uniref:Calpain small subunit 1 n=1 Tax=Takifugu rubripes TaxID=31033 RepID=A0A674NHZ3_TAKRU